MPVDTYTARAALVRASTMPVVHVQCVSPYSRLSQAYARPGVLMLLRQLTASPSSPSSPLAGPLFM